MKGNALGRRYAGSLIAIGRKDGQFERYGREISAALQVLGGKTTWSKFTSPLLPEEAKIKIVDEIAKRSGWSETVDKFLKVLVERKRIQILPSVVDAYGEMADEAAGRTHATVESAAPLDDATTSRLIEKLKKMLNKQVILDARINADLLGGIRVTVGSTVYDGTIRGQLTRMKDLLIKE